MKLSPIAVEAIRKKALPFEHVQIVCLGDIHYGAEGCDVRKLRHDLAEAQERNSFYLGLGDFVDFASPSNRGRLGGMTAEGTLYDSAQDLINDAAEETVNELTDILQKTKGRWLGMIEGHHYWTFPDGTTSTQRLCQNLDAPYLGVCAYVLVEFPFPGARVAPGRLAIWCHHGHGGGLNKLEHVVKTFDADIYLIGHMHRLVSARIQRLSPLWGIKGGRPRLQQRDMILACTGSYLRGYIEDDERGSYVERKMLAPFALGNLTIQVRPRLVEGKILIDARV